jgi:ribosome maturation factor RimP
MSALTEKIEESLSPLVNELGCTIVRVAILNYAKRKTLQIMIEKADGTTTTIEDCEKISKAVSVSLDVSEPISGHYDLEVSSTGIDRPLIKPSDFLRFCGKPVVIKTYTLKNERKIFKGNLESVSEDGIKLVLEAPLPNGDSVIDLTFNEISSAHIDGFKL